MLCVAKSGADPELQEFSRERHEEEHDRKDDDQHEARRAVEHQRRPRSVARVHGRECREEDGDDRPGTMSSFEMTSNGVT